MNVPMIFKHRNLFFLFSQKPIRSIRNFFILSILLFIFGNCFEYEENIYLKKGFTGYLEVNYTVPVNQRTGASVLKFLPLNQEDIENKINKGIFGKTLKIRDYSMRFLEKEEISISSYFQKKAKVSYKVDFTEISSLDGILLGNLFVKRRGNSIFIKREFKSVMKPLDQESSAGEKKIRAETLRLLGDGYAQFRIFFPQSSECKSNLGEINLGMLNYKFPLNETIEKAGNKIWDFSITNF
jgi:hypothetical protein